MPRSKSGSNLREYNKRQRGAAMDYYLRHPDASLADVHRATGIPDRTVARARADLVSKGLLIAGRKTWDGPHAEDAPALVVAAAEVALEAQNVGSYQQVPTICPPDADNPPDRTATPRGAKRGELLDDEAMREMSSMLDELADSDDVEETRRRIVKQVQRWVFDPSLHPDTRMSASQLWAKLIDMARARDLGPGKPVTLADAIVRCGDFMLACGPSVYVPALNNVIARMEGAANAANEQTAVAGGATQASGPTGHDGAGAPVEVVRGDDVRGGRPEAPVQDSDHAGPTEGRPGDVSDPRTSPHLGSASPWT